MLNSTSPHLYAYSNGTAMALPYGNDMGAVRYNARNQKLEVESNGCWYPVQLGGEDFRIGMSVEADEAIAWASQRAKAEKRAAELSQQYPAVKLALDQVNEAYANLEMVTSLCE